MTGQTITYYEILEKLGEGGMGVVWKARDTRLDRTVALKFVKTDFTERFQREARAISALNHPRVATLYDIGVYEGRPYLVMEYVEGKPARGPLPWQRALRYAIQVADALTAAHHAHIIHRDLKPGNILVTEEGDVKLVDFGLAKRTEADETQTMAVVGTPGYMAPEQLNGKPADERTDIFAFGCVLYELLTGLRVPADREFPALKGVPAEIESTIRKCLRTDPRERWHSMAAVKPVLEGVQVRSPRHTVLWLAAVVLVLASVAWPAFRLYRSRWAENEAIPKAAQLAEKGEYWAAFDLAKKAQQVVPDSKALQQLWLEVSRTVSIASDPPGAEISFKEYKAVDGPWRPLGRAPLKDIRIPQGYLRFRVAKEGLASSEFAGPVGTVPLDFHLQRTGEGPGGMVRVPAATFTANLAGFGYIGPLELGEFWMDKFEVTNRQFKEFVDKGGYLKREYWSQPFVKDGRSLSFAEALAGFRDASGRPGPATWEAGSYPDGKDEFPVSGLSWYEAAAYAEFAGKSLPTLYHWYHAAQVAAGHFTHPFSNFGGSAPVRVGSRGGLGPFGTYDMLGNVKEWCWNQDGAGRRYILGGAWNEPDYMFYWSESNNPFDRSAGNGFRCVKYGAPLPASLTLALPRLNRDYSQVKPVSDEAFRVIRSMYAYERAPLEPKVVSEDSSSEHWRTVKVTYSAGYGNERIPAFLFLPLKATPPFQTVLFFPGAGALNQKSSENLLNMDRLGVLLKSGRAVLHPIYTGTYERRTGLRVGEHNREVVTQWTREISQSVDYLESRPDIDRQRLAYCGLSWGSRLASIFLALEPRFRVALLWSGGFSLAPRGPEIDEVNFAPRVRTPVLMINGQFDFIFPIEASQKPMFRLLGTRDKDKQHLIFAVAHDPFAVSRGEVMGASLDWLDRYLGPVKTR